jgi:plasmid stabilization system protein ParE
MNDRGCVALLGDFSNERLDLAAVARDFGWSVTQTSDEAGLREIARMRTVVAVLADAPALGPHWEQGVRLIRAAAPKARIIVCHKAELAPYKTEMVDAGAFGVLLSPLAHSEVRQSLGFVWASMIAPLNAGRSAASQRASAA